MNRDSSPRTGLHLALAAIVITLLSGLMALCEPTLPVRLFSYKHGMDKVQGDLMQRMADRVSVFTVPNRDGYDPMQMLALNGYVSIWTSEAAPDLMHDTVLGIMPAWFSRHLDSALVIGAGTGVTPSATAAAYKDVWVVDINPNTVPMMRYFSDINDDALDNRSVHLVIDDAASWLRRTDRRFDTILIQTTSPATRGAASVFTKAFFELARSRLNPGGVLAVWIGVADSARGMTSIINTLGAVFPHQAWYKIHAQYAVGVASKSPIEYKARDFRPDYSPGQQQRLTRYISSRPGDNAGRLGESIRCNISLAKNTMDTATNTLNHPVLSHLAMAGWGPQDGLSVDDMRAGTRWLKGHLVTAPAPDCTQS